MSRAFNKAVVARFEAGMTRFPQWRATKPPTQHSWPGERAYRYDHSPVALWLSLVLSPKGYNEFTIECGWSRFGRYPELSYRPNIAVFTEAELDRHPEAFFRLPGLDAQRREWWSIAGSDPLSFETAARSCAVLSPQEADVLAEPLVSDALACIASAEPQFDAILRNA